ncbi:MAG: hypothetical protein NTV34_10960 [Proteobacteria bacterium]|nr:hypothetical protein [Pseudomonadota bacterium]
MIELAQRFAQSPTRRSIVFMAASNWAWGRRINFPFNSWTCVDFRSSIPKSIQSRSMASK